VRAEIFGIERANAELEAIENDEPDLVAARPATRRGILTALGLHRLLA
jgi:hypothetical protein